MKDIVKKQNVKLIKPAEFDTLFNVDGERIEVATPYSVMNVYNLNTAPSLVTDFDIAVRRHTLRMEFADRAKFLFYNCLFNLNSRLNACTEELYEKSKENKSSSDNLDEFDHERHYRHLLYISPNRFEHLDWFKKVSIYDIDNYFYGFINEGSCVDISMMIMSNLYNEFVFNAGFMIRRFGFGILNNYVLCFRDFQMELISSLKTLIDEVINIYAEAGVPGRDIIFDETLKDCEKKDDNYVYDDYEEQDF